MQADKTHRSLTVRFREELIQDILKVSKLEEISMSDIIRKAVKEYVSGK